MASLTVTNFVRGRGSSCLHYDSVEYWNAVKFCTVFRGAVERPLIHTNVACISLQYILNRNHPRRESTVRMVESWLRWALKINYLNYLYIDHLSQITSQRIAGILRFQGTNKRAKTDLITLPGRLGGDIVTVIREIQLIRLISKRIVNGEVKRLKIYWRTNAWKINSLKYGS